MKLFIPIMVAAGLFLLISVLFLGWKSRRPSSYPIPVKSVGINTLDHGGAALVCRERPRADRPLAQRAGRTAAR